MANFSNPGAETNLSNWYAGKQPSDITSTIRAYNDPAQEGYSDGDAVATVHDYSGNSYNATQSSSSLKPTFKNNGTDNVNGNPSFYFDGGDKVTNSGATAIAGDAWTAILVLKRGDNTQPRTMMGIGLDSGNYPLLSRYTSKFFINPSGSGSTAVSTSDIPTSASILLAHFDGTNTKMSVDGETDSSTNQAGAFSYSAGYILGDYATSGGQEWLGNLFASLQYSSNLSNQNINDLISYFALRFAITMGSGWGANVTRNTSTKRTGVASIKVVTNASYATDVYEIINPGTTGSYLLQAYAYTDGSTVTSSDVELFYNGSAITTTITADSGGWYKLSATVTGAAANRKCGVQVKANKTVYLDDFTLVQPPSTPTNSTPTNAATDVERNPTLTSSAFSDGGYSHVSSQWQIATDSGFSSVVWDSGTTTTNKTSVVVNTTNGTFSGVLSGKTKLNLATQYYFRVRYTSSSGAVSSYSSGTLFTVTSTAVTYKTFWVKDEFGKFPRKITQPSNFIEVAGSDGEIQFNDDGEFGSDSGFVYDKAQNRMGIGNASPNAALDIVGDFFIADSITPSKKYRFQTSGGALDLNAGGAPFILGVFPNGDFTGTFKYYFAALSASHLMYLHGEWQFKTGNAGYDQGSVIFTIKGPSSSGDMVIFNDEGNDYDLRMEGDTDTSLFFLDASTDTIEIGKVYLKKGQKVNRTAVNDTAYTALATDYIIAYTALSAGRTVTLPAAATAGAGTTYVIKDESGNAGTNNITIDGNGSETIDGSLTIAINTNYGNKTIYTNGSNWYTI